MAEVKSLITPNLFLFLLEVVLETDGSGDEGGSKTRLILFKSFLIVFFLRRWAGSRDLTLLMTVSENDAVATAFIFG